MSETLAEAGGADFDDEAARLYRQQLYSEAGGAAVPFFELPFTTVRGNEPEFLSTRRLDAQRIGPFVVRQADEWSDLVPQLNDN